MPIIEIKELSKKYCIADQPIGYLALRDSLAGLYKKPLSIFKKSKSHEFYALNKISLDIEKGDVLGIIGSNGAGKSTLLKILSKITPPTSGRVIIKGKVASLLEVGTGFHPELTGRENIYLNGTILGMSKKEIADNFDEIVRFSGVDKFLDTPVKHYSSGMYVRLAFSVAAHMSSDILFVDEVLAVGDMEFQKKCLKKINELTKNKERTVVFVSHNLNSIQCICNKCLLIEGGKIQKIGKTKDVISEYLKIKRSNSKIILQNNKNINQDFDLIAFELANSADGSFSINCDSPIEIKIKFYAKKDMNFLSFVVGCKTMDGTPLFSIRDVDYMDKLFCFEKNKIYDVGVNIEHNLVPGSYILALDVIGGNKDYSDYQIAILKIVDAVEKKYPVFNNGVLNCKASWSKISTSG